MVSQHSSRPKTSHPNLFRLYTSGCETMQETITGARKSLLRKRQEYLEELRRLALLRDQDNQSESEASVMSDLVQEFGDLNVNSEASVHTVMTSINTARHITK